MADEAYLREGSVRIGFFEAAPHPVHRAFREAVGAEPICGWGMAWSKGRPGLVSWTVSRGIEVLLEPLDARRFRGRYDVLIAPSYGLRLAARVKRLDSSVRVVYFNYCPFLDWVLNAPPLHRAYHLKALAAVDGVVSGSALNAERARALLKVPQAVCHPFGGEAARGFRPADEARTLLAVGSLHPVKRVDRAIDVIRTLREQSGPDWRLVIVGDGPGRARLEERARGLEGVRFTGWLSFESLAHLYAEAFALLQLSEFDNFPVTVLEAASAGVFPLVSDTTGSVEILPPALIVKDGEPEKAVEAIVALTALSPEDRGRLRARCREAASPFTRKRQTERFRQTIAVLLEEIAGIPAKRSAF